MNSYLYIKVESSNINKFLQKCNKNGINIINVKYISYKSIIVLINEKDYKRIKKIGINKKISIVKKNGKNRYIEILKNNKVFFISCLIGIIILIVLSNIIFKIEIISDNNELKNIIKTELSNNGIEKYRFMKNFDDIEIIKKNIINKYRDNIEWMEISRIGTKYRVNVVERKIKKIESSDKIYSLVANKSGVVRGIFTEKGISLVEKGDYVKKGDILVSSDIKLNDNLKNRISVKSKVYAETWYKVRVEYPLDYSEKKYTNNKRKTIFVKISNKYIEPLSYNNYDRKKKVVYKDRFNLFEIGLEEIREIKIINNHYSVSEALKKANEEAKNKIDGILEDDEYIINEKTLNFYNNGSKIIVDIFFSIYEQIGELREIEKGD